MMTKRNKVFNVLAMVTLLTTLVGGSAYTGVKAYPEIEAAKTAKTYVESVHREVERHEVEDVVNHDWTDACRFRRLSDEVKKMGNRKEDYSQTCLNGVTTITSTRLVGYHMAGLYYVEYHTYEVNDRDLVIVHTCDTKKA